MLKWVKLGPDGTWINKGGPNYGQCGIVRWYNKKGYTFAATTCGVHIRGPARTLKEAKANCEAHAKRYGRKEE